MSTRRKLDCNWQRNQGDGNYWRWATDGKTAEWRAAAATPTSGSGAGGSPSSTSNGGGYAGYAGSDPVYSPAWSKERYIEETRWLGGHDSEDSHWRKKDFVPFEPHQSQLPSNLPYRSQFIYLFFI
jgi:hypothetical protein